MLIGRVAGPFGLRGDLKVDLQTDFPERFQLLDHVYLGPDFRGFVVQRSRLHTRRTLLKLEGIDTPEQVKDIQGHEIFVPRSEAIPLPEGHYYLDDLLGLSVVTESGTLVGRVCEVLRTGANDVYVVNEGRAAILVPAIKDAVRRIDTVAGQIIIEDWVLARDE